MRQLKVVLLAVFAVFALSVALPAVSAQETATETPTATPTPTETVAADERNDTEQLGTQLTAFLQSSSAAANDSVENGMWKANFERASEARRGDIVTKRAGTLEKRLERLEAQNDSLEERFESGEISKPAYIAQQSRLSARIDALKTAVGDADTAAKRAGVEDSRLEQLVQSASELTGPEVAEIARGLGGGPPAEAPGHGNGEPAGPSDAGPSDAGPSDAGSTENNGTTANETTGQAGNESTSSDEPGKSGEAKPDNAGHDDASLVEVGRALETLLPL